jgi:DNA-directed RNA polymerase specialized sigma24 family protein
LTMSELYPDTNLNERFDEARITPIANRLMRFLVAAYGPDHVDDYEDYVQEGLIKLWQHARRNPLLMDGSDAHLYIVAKAYCRNAMGSAYSRKCRHIHTKGNRNGPKTLIKREFTMNEVLSGAQATDEDLVSDRIYARATSTRFTHDSPEVRQADNRLELEALLKIGMARLKGRQLQEVRLLLADMLLGYNQIETARRHGWTENRVHIVARLMRKTFMEAATSNKRKAGEGISKPKATNAELQRVRALKAKGLSQRKVAALISRSPAFVQQHWHRC